MTEHIIATVNGIENVDLSNVKCPICGNKMEVHRYGPQDDEHDGHLDYEPSRVSDGCVRVFRSRTEKRDAFGLQCPHCKAELNVTQTVVKQFKRAVI